LQEIVTAVRKNKILDDGEFYYLEHTSRHIKVKFDRDERVLSALLAFMNKNGGFSTCGNGKSSNRLINANTRCNIHQVLYSLYYNKPMEWVRMGRVCVINLDATDIRKENLTHTHSNAPDTNNRHIWHDETTIYFLHKKSGEVHYTDYEPELYDLLCVTSLNWKQHKHRLHAFLFTNGERHKRFCVALYILIYGYHRYGVRSDNFVEAVLAMQQILSDLGLVIVHNDSDMMNHRIENLSASKRNRNRRKG
jgi:hypothetical protein